MRKGKNLSIKSRMIGALLAGWFVPFILMAVVVGYYMSSNHFDTQISKEQKQLEFESSVSAERLNQIITAAKAISYDKRLENEYARYRQGEISRNEFRRWGDWLLYEYYDREKWAETAVLWFSENPSVLNSSIYNERLDGSYAKIKKYWEEDHENIRKYAETLDTRVGFYQVEDRLYLVRNLRNSYDRKNMGVLVFRLHADYCFGNLTNTVEDGSVTVKLDDCQIPLKGEILDGTKLKKGYDKYISGYVMENKKLMLFQKLREQDYKMEILLQYDNESMWLPFYGYQFIIVGMLILLIPLLAYVIYVFKNHVSVPVEEMMQGAEKIEKGEFGYQLTYEPKSTEFGYLIKSFNRMSEKLDSQFKHIYEEELALRDAKIMALQSHINPHFMNNTLEIINWEARLAGNAKVSKMLEALSTLMNATIDRKKRPEVPLSEEMMYVNAYLYILSERFGKRLTVNINLPDEIMQIMVPRLVLQPLIENAIEHGAAKQGKGTVEIRGYKEDKYLYLDIMNDGKLTEEDSEKIKRLLSLDYDTSKESSGSMGIANVNQRLHILYGEPSGLTIFKDESGQIVTHLTILADKQNKIRQ